MVMLNAQTAQSEDDFGGRSRPQPGRYHVAVNHAEEKGSKKKGTPGLEIEFQVICDGLGPDGKTPTSGQAGKTMPLFLAYVSEKGDDATKTCIERVTRLALCTGVLNAGEAKEPDWSEAVGRELVIEVEAGDKYTDDKGNERAGNSQVSFLGFWSLGNRAVANVPRDPSSPGMKALAGKMLAGVDDGRPKQGNGNGNSANGGGNAANTATAATANAATAAASPSKKKWSNL